MVEYVVFASGSGSDFFSAVKAEQAGKIPHGKIVALISNKEDAYALTRAKENGIRAEYLGYPGFDALPTEKRVRYRTDNIIRVMEETNAKFFFMAGYLLKMPKEVLARWPGFNIHPAYDMVRFGGQGMHGMHVHEAVIKARVPYSGATIHAANENYDEGDILMQRKVLILPGDTPEGLQKRVLEIEHEMLPEFLNIITRGMIMGKCA